MVLSRTFACGTCRLATRKADAVDVSADDMRALARNGFGEAIPLLADQPPEQRRDLFRQFADNYATSWTICPACAAKAEPYRPPGSSGPLGPPRVAFPGRARAAIGRFASSNPGKVVMVAVVLWLGMGVWETFQRNKHTTPWWWQSHNAMSAADAKARQKDWGAARDILQRALAENPGNAPLLRRMGNVQMLLGRPDLAAFHYRAFATTAGVDRTARDRADIMADGIDRTLRERARVIYEEVYRLYRLLPPAMRQADGPPFDALEAISIPPRAVSANISIIAKMESLDGTQVLCTGLFYSAHECGWPFATQPWLDILAKRRIAVTAFTKREGHPPCCALSLDDPDIADPAATMRRIAQMPPAHQLRAMFALASKLAFVANTIAFNDRKRERLPR